MKLRPPAKTDNWNQHWEEFTPSAELSPANAFRRRAILGCLDIPHGCEFIHMLEIGSGTGEFAEEFSRRYPNASFLGLELSHKGVEISSRRVPSAEFRQCNLLLQTSRELLPATRANFAVCSEVLEHLDDPVVLLRNAAAYMAPGCKLVVTVPGGPISALDRHLGHRRHYTPRELRTLLERANFTVEAAYATGFPFFNLYRTSVILRGERLRRDISGEPSSLVRTGMAIFHFLLRFNFPIHLGWQVIAVARNRNA